MSQDKMISLSSASGNNYPALNVLTNNHELAALVSKLVDPVRKPPRDREGNVISNGTGSAELQKISSNKAQDITDAQSIIQLLPDMELSIQILISSIMSPKDMMTGELTFSGPDSVLTTKTSSAITNLIRQHFDQSYKIKQQLPNILKNVLFERGSHVLTVIPENSIDELINRNQNITMEDLKETNIYDDKGIVKNLGILGSRNEISTGQKFVGIANENFSELTNAPFVGEFLTLEDSNEKLVINSCLVTDNINILRLPFIADKLRSQKIKRYAKNTGIESISTSSLEVGRLVKAADKKDNPFKDLGAAKIQSILYKKSPNRFTPIISLKGDAELKRRSIGAPLVMELPSESVIPVFTPGNKNRHVGYFILIDNNGNPVCKDNTVDYYQQLENRFNNGASSSGNTQASKIIEMVRRGMGGVNAGHINRDHIDAMAKVFEDMIEKDLIARLKNGIYTNGAELGSNTDVARIMMSRVLAGQNTQLLFIPSEMVTYFALKYDENGMGKSMLDDMKILNSLRVVLMFSNIMASIRNSIGKTNVNIKFDEDDPDPQKTADMMMDAVMKSRANAFPVGSTNPADIVNYLQRAGVNFTYEGHPGWPDVKADVTESSLSSIKPDNELDEMLRNRSIQATGVTPEMVDAGSGAEFATSVANNHILLSRRVLQIQQEIEPELSSHARKIFYATPSLVEEAKNIIKEDFTSNVSKLTDEEKKIFEGPEAKDQLIEMMLDQFINGIELKFPRPNSVTMENQFESLEQYTNLLDKSLDFVISSEFMNQDMIGDASTSVDSIKSSVKAYLVRKFMSDNGIMPELGELTALDEFGKPKSDVWQEQQDHIETLVNNLKDFIKKRDNDKTSSDTELEASGIQLSGSSGGGSDWNSSSSTGDSSTDSADEFGLDAGGSDLDIGSGTDDAQINPSEQQVEDPSESNTQKNKSENSLDT